MIIRIAILAACAGTLALAQADIARASYGAASESGSLARLTDVEAEPVIVLAQNGRSVSGSNIWSGGISTSRSRVAPKAGKNGVWVQPGDYDGDGRGRFRTRGRHSSATVRGIRMKKPGTARETKELTGTLVLNPRSDRKKGGNGVETCGASRNCERVRRR